jgi:hypothetical protein
MLEVVVPIVVAVVVEVVEPGILIQCALLGSLHASMSGEAVDQPLYRSLSVLGCIGIASLPCVVQLC